jgi:uncharacterized membrane protein YdbT with pleckstrin-like domain
MIVAILLVTKSFVAFPIDIEYINFFISVVFMLISIIVLATALYDLFYVRNTIYIIKEEQIVVKMGIFVRQVNYVEMYRIYDYVQTQNFFETLFLLMTVKILSRDISHPALLIRGIQYNPAIVDIIRTRVEAIKRKKGVVELNS